ncbi:peptidoglycan peptidase [Paracoccus marinaquae]|uniref:Peptidoglycan peptidase n=1 Tax=Paracoccus marinaquae TaxID=2841926 RepID=A0ABS6AIC9_9RHOB|nr:peptidoglycan peptidase [Paracoccus marinaquae]MBU3030303.1 peptidoglycan peptidase [Paracoccus marinaquae]
MRRILLRLSLVLATFSGSSAFAQDSDYTGMMAEAAWDWLPGDLVFRNGLNDFDEIVRQNESGEWASVGVIRPSSGGPVVIYVDQEQGVTETPLDLFIESEAYAVFRVKGLEAVRAESYDLGPMALFSGIVAFGMPYDTELMLENGKLYNAELPFAAALNAGVMLVAPKPLRDVTTIDAPLGEALLENRIGHFPCIEATDTEMCWGWMKNLAIVTPGMIVSSDVVVQVYP